MILLKQMILLISEWNRLGQTSLLPKLGHNFIQTDPCDVSCSNGLIKEAKTSPQRAWQAPRQRNSSFEAYLKTLEHSNPLKVFTRQQIAKASRVDLIEFERPITRHWPSQWCHQFRRGETIQMMKQIPQVMSVSEIGAAKTHRHFGYNHADLLKTSRCTPPPCHGHLGIGASTVPRPWMLHINAYLAP